MLTARSRRAKCACPSACYGPTLSLACVACPPVARLLRKRKRAGTLCSRCFVLPSLCAYSRSLASRRHPEGGNLLPTGNVSNPWQQEVYH